MQGPHSNAALMHAQRGASHTLGAAMRELAPDTGAALTFDPLGLRVVEPLLEHMELLKVRGLVSVTLLSRRECAPAQAAVLQCCALRLRAVTFRHVLTQNGVTSLAATER